MRKRLTAWLLALVMALTLVGCRDDVTVIGVTTGGDQTPQQQEQQEAAPCAYRSGLFHTAPPVL